MKIESQLIVIFGATGDLAKRKLIPAFYHLLGRGALDGISQIVCLGRKSMSDRAFIEHLQLHRFIAEVEPDRMNELTRRIHYRSFDLDAQPSQDLGDILDEIRTQFECIENILFYLALPTTVFDSVARVISPLVGKGGWQRVVFEKPFGENLESAEQLNRAITTVLAEDQIYRVDHYLGKELVQNILFLRFTNEIFSSAWNRDAIDHVQISVSESLGVEDRAAYYDHSGAIRDMLQNHLLQLLSLTAMEPPLSGHGNAVRDESARIIEQLRIPRPEDIVVGQYAAGRLGQQEIKAYRDEPGVAPDSTTETYVAVRVYIDNPRWRDTPFYLRTGKRLANRRAEIRVVFKHNPINGMTRIDQPNVIVIRIQPNEGIALAFNVRKPGDNHHSESVQMDFCHQCHFGPNTPEAYEAILASVMRGDPLLFTRWDWLQASWKFIDQLKAVAPPVVFYEAGTEGPPEATALLTADNRSWR